MEVQGFFFARQLWHYMYLASTSYVQINWFWLQVVSQIFTWHNRYSEIHSGFIFLRKFLNQVRWGKSEVGGSVRRLAVVIVFPSGNQHDNPKVRYQGVVSSCCHAHLELQTVASGLASEEADAHGAGGGMWFLSANGRACLGPLTLPVPVCSRSGTNWCLPSQLLLYFELILHAFSGA